MLGLHYYMGFTPVAARGVYSLQTAKGYSNETSVKAREA